MPNIDELLLTIVQPLVDHPEDLTLNIQDSDDFLEYHLLVHPDDMGRVIGRNGRVINAIRTIIYSIRAENGRRIRLIIDKHS
ncbi:RNA-binding protein [Aerococcus urinaehominis]|uniref:RNA-binding protein KhpA n=1 Tax=Aerococcus urinaehominis TaxID=128944 RepID=A0A109RGC8_9LACT|nr:KH domain-containing protein [Aerococcus urinaehominis]AMB98951.1 RNA-binding protein [Aerococcus urinaehominis]SDM40995.1 hypothetical protein SAMN04487985_11546 [Aerococcus urinaehominis]